VRNVKLSALRVHGRPRCEACSFDFEDTYGSRGSGFIEAHHTKPLYTLTPGDKTRLEDLALLCSNCHRMIHALRPWFTVEELKQTMR
jgi:5-methylcytosine-specific restriction enzyme A